MESEPASFRAEYDATAEKRVDGKGVTIGQSSRLFFDSAIDEYVGKSIMTMTQLRSYKEFIDSRVAALERRAGNYPVSLVYVYIPDYATIYSEYLPESVEKETVYTRLEQIKQNLDGSNAVILDMTDVLMAAKDDEYPIYNSTDSHLSEYGGYLVYKGIFNAGQLVEFIGYFTAIVWPVMAISELINMHSQGKASLLRITELLDAPIEVKDSDSVTDIPQIKGDIEFKNLTFRYPSGEYDALSNVSFQIKAGENVGIIGRTGSGKTTVVDLILRTYNVPDGTVFIDGRDINSIPIKTVRRFCAYVPGESGKICCRG